MNSSVTISAFHVLFDVASFGERIGDCRIQFFGYIKKIIGKPIDVENPQNSLLLNIYNSLDHIWLHPNHHSNFPKE